MFEGLLYFSVTTMFEHSDLDGMSGIDMNNVQDLLNTFQSSSFRVGGDKKMI